MFSIRIINYLARISHYGAEGKAGDGDDAEADVDLLLCHVSIFF